MNFDVIGRTQSVNNSSSDGSTSVFESGDERVESPEPQPDDFLLSHAEGNTDELEPEKVETNHEDSR
jgi:hypothetical protein